MTSTQPQPLTSKDWSEIGSISEIRESWGIEEGENFADAASHIYAVKFDFVSGSPGYVGELFVLQGDALTGDPPFVLRRGDSGALVLVDNS